MMSDHKDGDAGGSTPVVKTGKTEPVTITVDTVRTLERAGSSESAKIARDYVKSA